MAKDHETEEGRWEEETETVLDTEMEQQAGDKEEARGGPDWNKFMEMMSSINEKLDKNKEETNENFRRHEEKINSTHEGLKKSRKQMKK